MCEHLKIHICVKVVFKYKFYIKPREILYGLDLYLNFLQALRLSLMQSTSMCFKN